jgi:hypothetical protein
LDVWGTSYMNWKEIKVGMKSPNRDVSVVQRATLRPF